MKCVAQCERVNQGNPDTYTHGYAVQMFNPHWSANDKVNILHQEPKKSF